MTWTLRTDLRNGVRIARVEVVRSVRAILTSQRQLLAFGLMVLALLPAALLFVNGSYAAGRRFADGTTLPVVRLARAQVTTWVLSLSVLFSLRMVERAGNIDHADLVLTTVSPRAVVVGLVLAEFARILAVFGPPVALLLGAFALGADAPLMLVTTLPGVLPLFLVGLLGGFVLGHLGRLGARRLGGVSVPRTAANIAVVLAIVVGVNVFAPDNPAVVVRSVAPLAASPVGPYADLLLVASPFAVPVGPGSVVAALLLVSAVPLLGWAGTRVATRVWLGDPVTASRSGGETVESSTGTSASVSVPFALAGTRTTRLVWWLWLRGLRAPTQFVHLAYFLFMAFPLGQSALADPRGPLLPIFTGLVGAFLAGATFGLNPLGVERSMLPAILTVRTPGRAVVRTRFLAGQFLWLPVTLGAVLATGLYSRLDPASVVAIAVVTAALGVFSGTVALALGSFAPRFDPVRSFGGVEAPTPTSVALLGHTFLTSLVAGVGYVLVFLPDILNATGRSRLLVEGGGLGAWVLVVGSITVGCYQYAVGRLDGFTYD